MKILVEYEASWRNSFLDGDNNSPLPKAGREYVGSMTALKGEGNFIERTVTLDTVMGLLNRLIGDQRKLYQARESKGAATYYFENIESKVRFEDKPLLTNEIIYVRNMKGSTDQSSFTGMIKSTDEIFSSDYSRELWGILKLDLPTLCSFITVNEVIGAGFDADPLVVCAAMEELEKLNPVINEGYVADAVTELGKYFPNTSYINNKGLIIISSLYCSSLYLQLDRLSKRFNTSSARTKSGGISGISKRGFTKKDFMDRFTTGKKKILWGNPYMLKKFVKGKGGVTLVLTKARGRLEITIDVDQRKGQEIKELIKNAGVSAFYLGKKGLAYVSKIRI